MHSRNVRRPTAVRFHRRPAHLWRIHNFIIYGIGTCILYTMCCNSSHADRRRRRRCRPTLARSINGNPRSLLSSSRHVSLHQ